MKALLATALLLFAAGAHACINEVGTDRNGRRFDSLWYLGEGVTEPMRERSGRRHALERAKTTIAEARKQPSFESLTNLGVLLIYQGQYPLAIRHFLSVERRYPGHHETAANLGTALELAGQDSVALRWIRLGIQRNVDEHLRSEWLHARILEAKIAAARDPAYLQRHSIAGLRFEAKTVPALPTSLPPGNDGQPLKPWMLDRSLSYQLRERTQFVPAPDPVVANLLSDWATLNLAGGPLENAAALYDLAADYGAPRDALMRERQAYIRKTIVLAKLKDSEGYACAICEPMTE
ncbi:tetratricopeptide repeat protein [Lysobacter silvisoli]|uniref:Tetratricopeptide repeat protein n=1 Tax=Lysobacter silvisoli TaxID=2293254 RepID=A0A371JWH6_9GAMM|nr:tetratricopeptide repeat protein [Lysobacter silvisoli]RDZ25964.1 tetratricopeptide repeat protein [Lysobacter silvisoli]